jgi:hypothetical protein
MLTSPEEERSWQAVVMQMTTACHDLIRFRRVIYEHALGQRKDSLCDLTDAILTSPGAATLARLSLAPGFRRRWSSVSDALSAGRLDVPLLRRLLVAAEASVAATTGRRPLWALDASTWPRPAAHTSPERTYAHRVAVGTPQRGVVAGWEYQWLVAVPEAYGSWVLPLDVRRRRPPAGTATALAITQLRQALSARSPVAPRPVVTLDSGYDPVALAQAHLPADLLVRLARHRVFYRVPPPRQGRGRPRRHGAPIRFKDATTWGTPDQQAALDDPDYGRVIVAVWAGLHAKAAADTPLTVVRVDVERLPRRRRPPAPLWLAWIGGPLPADLHHLWRWYLRRFAVEHGFRFAKHDLGWTTVRPAHPDAADRWTWLVAVAFWELWLARPLVADQRLPWDRPLPADRLTPGRVRRACPALLPQLDTPARPPQPRGKAPGRLLGQCPGPRVRHPVVRRHTKIPQRQRKRAA